MKESFGLLESLWRGTALLGMAFFYSLLCLPYEAFDSVKKIFSRRNLDDLITLAIVGAMSFYCFLTRKKKEEYMST